MSISNLVIAFLATYFLCSLILAYLIARMSHNRCKGYVFRVRWYHKAASTYVLALPIFLLLAYLITTVSLLIHSVLSTVFLLIMFFMSHPRYQIHGRIKRNDESQEF